MDNIYNGKRFLIIGIVVAVLILIFTAVFTFFSSKEIAEMEKQLSDLTEEYKVATTQANEYATVAADVDVDGVIQDVLNKGNKVAEIQNKMIKFEFETVDPIAAPNEANLIDKKTRNELKALLSEEYSYYSDSAWFLGKSLKCKFNPVFQYKNGRIPVIWTFISDDRPVALAVGVYDPDKKVFDDISTYKTMFGNDVTEEAFNLMKKRVTGEDTSTDEQLPENLHIVDESDEADETMLQDDENGEAVIGDVPVDGTEEQQPATEDNSTNKKKTTKEGE